MREPTPVWVNGKASISNLSNHSFEFIRDMSINMILNQVEGSGKIAMKSKQLSFRDKKCDQAQITDQRCFHLIHLEQIIDLDIKKETSEHDTYVPSSISGCTVTDNRRIFIADYYGKGKLLEYATSNLNIGWVKTIRKPYDITHLDNNRLAVTFVTSNL